MKEFFKVTDLNLVIEYISNFLKIDKEQIPLSDTMGRVLASELISDVDLPGFKRATMDGYALRAKSTFGASDSNPSYLDIKGNVLMGESPDFSIGPLEAAKISTGGMLPKNADSVVMIEYTNKIDETSIEVYKSVAPGQHIVEKGEDFKNKEVILQKGRKIRPQEIGLLAAFGLEKVNVYKKPVVGIISTGDEIVPINEKLKIGQIRDINSYSLSAEVIEAGGIPKKYGIVKDDFNHLLKTCEKAINESDIVLISGGSSVGTRDFTIDVLSSLPESEIVFHGITISPGKPTILANINKKPVWGLPGHVVSAMIVFKVVVSPYIESIGGFTDFNKDRFIIPATLTRNISSVPGRVDFVRVRFINKNEILSVEPVLGKSGLINTMVKADGLIKVGLNTEGLDKGTMVTVMPL